MAVNTTTVPVTMAATVEQLEARYKLWGAKINELEAAGESRRVQAKIDRARRIDGLKAKYQLARAKLDELKAAGSEKWEGFRSGVETAGSDLDTALRREESEAGAGTIVKGANMMLIAALVLVVLWGVALIASYTLGGYIHLLLLPALVIVALRLIRLRRAV